MSATPTQGAPAADAGVLLAAATAAAGLLPAPSPLVPGPTDGTATPDPTAPAVVATFTGAVSGDVAVVLDASVEEALAGAAGGPLPLQDAVAPALEAAVATLGPSVLAPARLVRAGELAGLTDLALVPLVGGTDVAGWFGLRVAGATTPAADATLAAPAPAAPTPSGSPVPAPRAAGTVVAGAATAMDLLRDVEMTVTVELGRARLPMRELLALTPGSVVELDRAAGSPADLLVNGRLIARGEIVVVDEDYGIRITEILAPGQSA